MVPTAEITVVLEPLALVVTVTTAGRVAVVVRMVGWAIVVTGMAESHLLFLFWASGDEAREKSGPTQASGPRPGSRNGKPQPQEAEGSRNPPQAQSPAPADKAGRRSRAACTCDGCAGRGGGGGCGVGRGAFLGARHKFNLGVRGTSVRPVHSVHPRLFASCLLPGDRRQLGTAQGKR